MSSAVGEDTVRQLHTGRALLGDAFSSIQTHLQKIFIIFVIGFVGSFYLLRIWIWDFLEATAKTEMSEHVAGQTDIITRTPFEVILLQAKIGLLVGLILIIPVIFYYSREMWRQRGFRSVVPLSRTYMALFGLTAFVLFWAGIIYAYAIFFPFAFDFLATNADQAGVKPSFGITEFTQFMALLTLSFGLAAQLPLFVGVFAYTEIVPYETFRDKWRHAVVAIVIFGALFSPPDPFTQIMWAIPLVTLYVFSLGLAKVVTNIRRRGEAEAIGGPNLIKQQILRLCALMVAIWGVGAVIIYVGGIQWIFDTVVPLLPASVQFSDPGYSNVGAVDAVFTSLIITLTVGFIALVIYTIQVLRGPVYPRSVIPKSGDPTDVDVANLSVEDIQMAPAEVFLAMEEEDALDIARDLISQDESDRAQAVITRFDDINERRDEFDGDGSSGQSTGDAADGEETGSDPFSSTAAGILDSFTEEETTEEDIGGYAYDIAFIFNSLTSKMFRIVGVFMLVMGGTFFWLYSGGLKVVLEAFVERVPDGVLIEVAERNQIEGDPTLMTTEELIAELNLVIALHPVEVLIFEVKVSTLAAIIVVLPMIFYYAWPAMKERGLAYGDRRLFIVWGGSLFVGFVVGTYLGFFWVAPAIISYLVSDAISAGMVVSYRIKSFFWLVIFTTVGIGFLANIIVTMALFHVGNIVSYRTMLKRWRGVVLGIFIFSALFSPKGILTMLLFAIPLSITYLLGLLLLYFLTAGGRLFGGGPTSVPESAAPTEVEPES